MMYLNITWMKLEQLPAQFPLHQTYLELMCSCKHIAILMKKVFIFFQIRVLFCWEILSGFTSAVVEHDILHHIFTKADEDTAPAGDDPFPEWIVRVLLQGGVRRK